MANKQDLVASISSKTGLTKKDSEKTVNAFGEAISDFLSKGEKVQLIGFGTFETRVRAAREGRNPQTGETIQIAEATIPAFKAGKDLRSAASKVKK